MLAVFLTRGGRDPTSVAKSTENGEQLSTDTRAHRHSLTHGTDVHDTRLRGQ